MIHAPRGSATGSRTWGAAGRAGSACRRARRARAARCRGCRRRASGSRTRRPSGRRSVDGNSGASIASRFPPTNRTSLCGGPSSDEPQLAWQLGDPRIDRGCTRRVRAGRVRADARSGCVRAGARARTRPALARCQREHDERRRALRRSPHAHGVGDHDLAASAHRERTTLFHPAEKLHVPRVTHWLVVACWLATMRPTSVPDASNAMTAPRRAVRATGPPRIDRPGLRRRQVEQNVAGAEVACEFAVQ